MKTHSHSMALALVALLLFPLIACGYPPAAPTAAPAGIFVAVGYGGRRMSSRDGSHWENVQQWDNKSADDSNNLISIAYGNGKFVVAGGGSPLKDNPRVGGHILVSTDGAHWRETKTMSFRISPLLFTAGRFVAGAPGHHLLWSLDGETWSEGAKGIVTKEIPGWVGFRTGIAGNGIFIFAGDLPAMPKKPAKWWGIATHDGQTIDHFLAACPPVRSLAFGGGRFLLVSGDALYTTKDGAAWHKEPAAPADKFREAVYTGSEFFLSGEKGAYASPDGISWKAFGKPIPCEVNWSNGAFFIGTGWPGKVWTSTDGRKWTRGEAPQPELGINQVVHGAVTTEE